MCTCRVHGSGTTVSLRSWGGCLEQGWLASKGLLWVFCHRPVGGALTLFTGGTAPVEKATRDPCRACHYTHKSPWGQEIEESSLPVCTKCVHQMGSGAVLQVSVCPVLWMGVLGRLESGKPGGSWARGSSHSRADSVRHGQGFSHPANPPGKGVVKPWVLSQPYCLQALGH